MKIPNKRVLEDAFVRWREHPVTFVKENFDIDPDPWQAMVLERFPTTPLIALQAPICVESDVWTPSGRRPWGTIQSGDSVFAEDGTVTTVVRRFNAGKVPLFKVNFCDGTNLRVSADHLWSIQTRYDRKVKKRRVVTTAELAVMPLIEGRQRGVSIPSQGAANFPYAALPADPYIFGLWLGDGVANEARLICPDRAIRVAVVARGQEISESEAVAKRIGLKGWMPQLRETGASECRSYEKFIPPPYKLSSIQQRLDLLRGLMDSDGTVAKNGQTYLATSSIQLAHDFIWLARSLGYYATLGGPYKINNGENRDSYRATISGQVCPFLAETQKRKRWRRPDPYKGRRFVDSVEPDGSGEAMCIEIAHPSHCFLASDFLVTHNCKGPGKTALEAWLGLNFLVTRPYAKIGATSIDGNNLRDNLWAELGHWLNKSPFLQSMIEWNSKRVFMKAAPENWFISARTWPKTGDTKAQADTLAGLHADYVMFLIDESGGIPPAVGVSAEAALSTGIECHIVQAGNPTDVNGMLYQASKDRVENGGRWVVIEITADPDDPMRAPRVKPEWARSQIQAYGRDNPWVMVNVLGKFPSGTIDTLISEEEVRAAQRRHYRRDEIADVARLLGIDVARQGLDASVIAMRQGIQMFPLRRFRNITGIEGAAVTNRIWAEFDADACFVDATGGFGFTWIDQLTQLGRQAIPVQFSGKASNEDRYINKRSEMYFKMVEWIRNGGAIPDDTTEGGAQLAQALYKTTYFHKRDMLQLEDKEQIKERLGFSPDEADAAVLTFAESVTAKRRGRPANHNAAAGDWSPFAQLDRENRRQYHADVDYDPYPMPRG